MISPKYTVSADVGQVKRFELLTDAKEYGETLARKGAWKGKYNVDVRYVSITYNIAPGHGVEMYHMPYPVRGTGTRAEAILAYMKRSGKIPFKWKKNENFKRACVRFRMGTRAFDEKYGGVRPVGDNAFEKDFPKKRRK